MRITYNIARLIPVVFNRNGDVYLLSEPLNYL